MQFFNEVHRSILTVRQLGACFEGETLRETEGVVAVKEDVLDLKVRSQLDVRLMGNVLSYSLSPSCQSD